MPIEVEQIKPYDASGSKSEQVRQMFDNIAPAYDFMNRAMTLGIDRRWRRVAVNRVRRLLSANGVAAPRVLDVATGTGDFALQLLDALDATHVTGIDLSEGMLDVARDKVAKRGVADRVTFEQGDCLSLPYADCVFDAVTVAFGVRNFEHIDRGLAQMRRVLRPGGVLCVLELSTPGNRLIRRLYDLYTLHIIPWFGSLRSGDREAYRYLPQSIAAVPQGQEMLSLMQQAGFNRCQARALTLDTCSLYLAVCP